MTFLTTKVRRLVPITGVRRRVPALAELYGRMCALEMLIERKFRRPMQIRYLESRIYRSPRDRQLSQVAEIREEAALPLAVRFWREATRRKPQVCIDIGANYGLFALAGHYSPASPCYAFEPNPYVYPYLIKSVREHPHASFIKPYQLAISDRVGEALFYVDVVKSGTSSLNHTPNFHGPAHKVRVEVTTLDEFFDGMRLSSSGLVLIKTDTEGNDYRILKGATKFLSKAKPLVGICEFGYNLLKAAGTPPEEFLEFLRQNFSLWLLIENPQPKIVRFSSMDNHPRLGNILYTNLPELVSSVADSLQIPRE